MIHNYAICYNDLKNEQNGVAHNDVWIGWIITKKYTIKYNKCQVWVNNMQTFFQILDSKTDFGHL